MKVWSSTPLYFISNHNLQLHLYKYVQQIVLKDTRKKKKAQKHMKRNYTNIFQYKQIRINQNVNVYKRYLRK